MYFSCEFILIPLYWVDGDSVWPPLSQGEGLRQPETGLKEPKEVRNRQCFMHNVPFIYYKYCINYYSLKWLNVQQLFSVILQWKWTNSNYVFVFVSDSRSTINGDLHVHNECLLYMYICSNRIKCPNWISCQNASKCVYIQRNIAVIAKQFLTFI